MGEQTTIILPREYTPLIPPVRPPTHKNYSTSSSFPCSTNHVNAISSTTPTSSLPAARRRAFIGQLFGVLAGAMQALAQTAIHFAFSSSASFPIFIPMLSVAVVFLSVSTASIKLRNIPSPITLSRSLQLLLLLRALFGGGLYAVSLVTLQNLPAPIAVTLFATAPCIASFLSAVFLRSALGPRDVLILLANIAGVVLVANPAAQEPHSSDGAGIAWTAKGVVMGVFNAFLIGASFTVAKALGRKVDASLHVLAMGVGALLLAPLVYDRGETMKAVTMQPGMVLLVFAGECFEWVSQYLMARAVKFCHPGRLLVMRSVNVPAVCLLSFFILGEGLGASQMLGVAVVLVSIAYNGMTAN